MSGTKRIDYRKGLRSLLRSNHPNRKLDAPSVELLVSVLNDVHGKLAEQFDAEYVASQPDKPFQLFAQKAVEKVFKGSLKKHAISEAARQLALFETGVMSYDLEKLKLTRAAKRERRGAHEGESKRPSLHPDAAFRGGISKLCQEGLRLDNRARAYLSHHLHHLTRMVGERALEIAGPKKEELDPLDLKRAVATFLGPQVMKIANSEGSRSLALHANGFLTFKPKPTTKHESSKSKYFEVYIDGLGKIFRSGIRKFLHEFSPDTQIDPKASKVVEDVLSGVAIFLCARAADACRDRGLEAVGDAQLKECVVHVFPDLLQQHALMQGGIDVDNFVQGILKYNWNRTDPHAVKKAPHPGSKNNRHPPPHSKKRLIRRRPRPPPKEGAAPSSPAKKASPAAGAKRPPSREKRIQLMRKKKREKGPSMMKRLDFTSGLLDLCPSVFPSLEVSVHRDATKEIGNILNGVSHQIAARAGEKTAAGSSLGIENIKDAVEELFRGELSHHAMSFASSIVMLNTSEDVH